MIIISTILIVASSSTKLFFVLLELDTFAYSEERNIAQYIRSNIVLIENVSNEFNSLFKNRFRDYLKIINAVNLAKITNHWMLVPNRLPTVTMNTINIFKNVITVSHQ